MCVASRLSKSCKSGARCNYSLKPVNTSVSHTLMHQSNMHRRAALLLALVAVTANALCNTGDPGRDGHNASLTVVTAGQPTGCYRANFFLDAVQTSTQLTCNGSQGIQGTQGIQGIQGLPPTITNLGSGCVSIVGVGTEVICNITGPQGLQGIQGIQGIQGVPPTVTNIGNGCISIVGTGTQVICNVTGAPTPIFFVDGNIFALTRAGIQLAIDAANAAGGGKVFVKADVTSDGTSLVLKSNVELSFMGRRFKLPPTSSSVNLITTGSSGFIDSLALTANANVYALNITVNVAQLAAATVPYVAGEVIRLFDPVLFRLFVTKIVSIDFATGSIALADSVVNQMLVSNSAVVAHLPTMPMDFTLRDVIFDANGNSGSASQFLHTDNSGGLRATYSGITLVGQSNTAATGVVLGVVILNHYASTVTDMREDSFKNGISNRAIYLAWSSHLSVTNLQSINTGGFGPSFDQCHRCTIRGLHVTGHRSRGFRVDNSAYSSLLGVVITDGHGTAGSGLIFAFNSHHNIVDGLIAVNNDNYGLSFNGGSCGAQVPCDSYNQVFNALILNNRIDGITAGSIIQGTNANYNFVSGTWDVEAADATGTLVAVSNNNGFLEQRLGAAHPITADFRQRRSIMWSLQTDAGPLRATVRGADGVLRVANITLT